jgi:5-methylcytosine-specific restriction endonuclease McrA
MKKCKKCNLDKTGNHLSYCKPCNSARVVAWKRQNREKYNDYMRNRSLSDLQKDKIQASKNKYVENNLEKVKEYKDSWRKENPEKYRAYSNKRRALKLSSSHSPYTEKEVLDLYGTFCHICKKEIDLLASRQVGKTGWETGLHLDHVKPISKGGDDNLQNVRPSHGRCNLSKGPT